MDRLIGQVGAGNLCIPEALYPLCLKSRNPPFLDPPDSSVFIDGVVFYRSDRYCVWSVNQWRMTCLCASAS